VEARCQISDAKTSAESRGILGKQGKVHPPHTPPFKLSQLHDSSFTEVSHPADGQLSSTHALVKMREGPLRDQSLLCRALSPNFGYEEGLKLYLRCNGH
jgi:hypothetical protein